MKTADLALIVGALAIAAGLVLIPRRATAGTSSAAASVAGFGGQAGALWTDARTAAYREQLARESGADWYGP